MPHGMTGCEARYLRKLRGAAYRAQGGLCWWCRLPMKTECQETDPRRLSGDHLVRLADGGETKPGNIVAACRECNSTRHPEMNSMGGGLVAQAGDDSVRSPFEVLNDRY